MNIRYPDLSTLYLTEDCRTFSGDAYADADASVRYTLGKGLAVSIRGGDAPLCWLRLRWNFRDTERRTESVRILGDAWERSYGDLEWRGIAPDRMMPWYILVSNGSDQIRDTAGRLTQGFGVETQPNTLCFWQYDEAGVTLWIDLRCGGLGVILGGRTLEACTVRFAEYRDVSAYEAGRCFCAVLCPAPRPTAKPVYGSNNWYYAYGVSSQEDILRDTALIRQLCDGAENRPYMVVDSCWEKNYCDAPWDQTAPSFPDMRELAREIRARDCIPGIWYRPLVDVLGQSGCSAQAHLTRDPRYLDPSVPEVLNYVQACVRRLRGWGYRLIKHDYTTADLFGDYGFAFPGKLGEDGWSFRDRSRTSGEIVLALYRAIRQAAEDDVVIGCNTLSHLSAGLFELYRIGDDTSGIDWQRTRRNGVNTLAFRGIQDGAFYACDADCMGMKSGIPWAQNAQWLRLLAASGTPLFLSILPGLPDDEQMKALHAAALEASQAKIHAVPLDWMENNSPARWLIDGEETHFDWFPPCGGEMFSPCEAK